MERRSNTCGRKVKELIGQTEKGKRGSVTGGRRKGRGERKRTGGREGPELNHIIRQSWKCPPLTGSIWSCAGNNQDFHLINTRVTCVSTSLVKWWIPLILTGRICPRVYAWNSLLVHAWSNYGGHLINTWGLSEASDQLSHESLYYWWDPPYHECMHGIVDPYMSEAIRTVTSLTPEIWMKQVIS